MPLPPPLPDSDDSKNSGPPPLPSSPTEKANAADPKDWLGALYRMGFREEEGTPKLAGLNLVGEFEGRILKVHASRRSRTRYAGEIRYRTYHGHRIEFNAETTVKTRCAMSELRSPLAQWAAKSNRWFGAKEIPSPASSLERYSIWASEPEWAGRFLAKPETASPLSCLLPEADTPPNIGLKWWPGFLTYSQRIDIQRVNAARMESWVRALLALARKRSTNC